MTGRWVDMKPPEHRHTFPPYGDPTWGLDSVWACECGQEWTWHGDFWGWMTQEEHDNMWPKKVESLDVKKRWRDARYIALMVCVVVLVVVPFILGVGLYG